MKPLHARILLYLVALLGTMIASSSPAQLQRIGPAPPILQHPVEGHAARLSHPSNVDLTFSWRAGEGGQTPTRFQLCVVELGQPCSASSAWTFPIAGAPRITGTSYRARLPAVFQGRRLEWTVAACAPSPLSPRIGSRELCRHATPRRLDWPLPPPTLRLPASDSSTSLRPILTVAAVPGAERYLFCLTRPGVTCPTEATHQADDRIEGVTDPVVVEVRQALQYAPPNELEQYRSRLMQWSAAACNSVVGCSSYQAPRHLTLVDTSRLVCIERADKVEVRNARYVARLPHAAGSFTLAQLPSGQQVATADTISMRLGGSPAWATDGNLLNKTVTVEKCLDFYARVRVEGSLPTSPWGALRIARTYEFTRSPHIYEQLEIRFEGNQFALPIRELVWQLSVSDPSTVRVIATTDDFIVRYPALGSRQPPLPGVVLPCIPKPECAGPSRSINLQHSGNPSPGVDLLREQVLLVNRAISLLDDRAAPLDFGRFRFAFAEAEFQFYPGFGIRGIDGSRYDFNNWDSLKYAIEDISPVPLDEASRQAEDWIVRLAMFSVEQLAEDAGWWRTHEWSGEGGIQFPRGDRFTDDARSFPALAYVWAHLALRQTRSGWRHFPADADEIYHQLQETYPWYVESDPAVSEIKPNPANNFADRSPSGTPYLSYSQHLKERYDPTGRTVKGVINAHGTALKWAWLMAEASRLFGDPVREADWLGIVRRYHPGSKEMLDLAYPDERFFGLIPYRRDQRRLTDCQKMSYIDHTFLGIAAGYDVTGAFEPEFADVVERAARRDTDPFEENTRGCQADGAVAWTSSTYSARLWRLFPAALAFARPEELIATECTEVAPPASLVEWGPNMSGSLHAASLSEVLEYDPRRPLMVHDPAKFIREGNGRKWILTNTRFQTYWSPGFWEEVDRDALPYDMLFDVKVTLPDPGMRTCAGEHFAAWRTGHRIRIMTDYSGGELTLEVPVWQTLQTVRRRLYDATTGRWGPEQVVAGVQSEPGPGGKTIVHLGAAQAKALLDVAINP